MDTPVHTVNAPSSGLPPQVPNSPPRRGLSAGVIAAIILGGFVLLTACSGLLIGLLLPSLSAARESARKLNSAASLAAIATALRSYAADNNGAYPESEKVLAQRLVPKYLPAVPGVGPDSSSAITFRYVPPTAQDAAQKNSKKILLYETPGMWKRAGGNLVYVDGTSKYVDGLKYDAMVGSPGTTIPRDAK